MYLYRITNNINQKVYIGITNNYKKRWANHGLEDTAISRAIRKYGRENFTFEVLFSDVPMDEIDELERQQIIKYNSLVPNGYNVAKGGMYNRVGAESREGEANNNAHLTYEEAKYIKDHRDQPIYVLYELYSDKLTYNAFKRIYHNETYKNIPPTVPECPNNAAFTAQFTSGNKLSYEEVVELRQQYANGVYWRDAYTKKYQELYPDEWTFWNIYFGNRYALVMPEVFTAERRKRFSSMRASGEKNGRAKLTADDVREIRRLWAEGTTRKALYEKYPMVTPTSIRGIINNKTWASLL